MADFFIDPTNGNDSNDGLTTGNSFLTLAKYTTTDVRSAGDTATCRNGLSDNLGAADLVFDEDGTTRQPIVIKADYVNAFSDDVAVTATGTFKFGSKAIILSADATAQIAAGDVIYANDDDPTEFSYQVALSQASDSGTDNGGDPNLLLDSVSTPFANTVLGTQIVNSTDGITGYVSVLNSNVSVQVTLDGRPVANGGTVVVFDNGDSYTIANQAVLYLPYKGDQAGSGESITNIQSPPLYNTPAGDFGWKINGDNWWFIQGLHIRGTDPNGNLDMRTFIGWTLKDCILEGNGASDVGIRFVTSNTKLLVDKCRFFNHVRGIFLDQPANLVIADCLLDGNSVSSSEGIDIDGLAMGTVENSEFRNYATGDIQSGQNNSRGTDLKFRNCLMLSATQIDQHNLNTQTAAVYTLEDFDGNIGDFRQLTYRSVAEGTPTLQSDTSKLRVGGSSFSYKVTPANALGPDTGGWGEQSLFGDVQVYMESGAAKTFTIFFAADSAAGWDGSNNPTANQFWIEVEYWGDALFNHRKITKSTGTVDFKTDTDFDQSLTVTVTPSKTGFAYLRGWYRKKKEGSDDNIFYVDPPGPGTIS